MSEFDLKDHFAKTRLDGKIIALMQAQTIALTAAHNAEPDTSERDMALRIASDIARVRATLEAAETQAVNGSTPVTHDEDGARK